jgi:hypothetical protein
MPSVFYRIVKLRKWFPPEDPLASKVARLCILREDFLLEMQGYGAEKIKELDDHSDQWRKTYFLRRMISTLNELASTVNNLLSDVGFKAILAKQPAQIRSQFVDVGRRIQEAQPVTKKIRDVIRAHVKEKEVQDALKRAEPEAFGLFEIASVFGKTHMKFVHELVAEIMLSDASKEERAQIAAGKGERIAEMFFLIPLSQTTFECYATDRGLLKP